MITDSTLGAGSGGNITHVRIYISSRAVYCLEQHKTGTMFARSIIRNFSTKSNILVVGGGQIGKSVALGLHRNGYENITVADPRPANQGELEAAGITFVTSSKGLGAETDVLFTALPKPEHVRFVMEESALMDELRKG